MKTALITFASATALSASLAFAQGAFAPMDFGDTAVIESVNGSELHTIDGKLIGTVSDANVDANKAEFIVDVNPESTLTEEELYLTVEEGMLGQDASGLVVNATMQDISVDTVGDEGDANEPARAMIMNK
ncbi:hypothetical protein [Marinibacterium profundimaris]|uniref:PRC-barrel domain-containing protein n=1 Tax=Marinibacterium profundimaris TaxID=1679460 RepID=A0A225NIK4_9RHOB|nr:hypothetical protein [Marinibacterium profundimaris]OWU72903.1 hypothetical protein ATO3_14530 [Marinibacterium profundimaris]